MSELLKLKNISIEITPVPVKMNPWNSKCKNFFFFLKNYTCCSFFLPCLLGPCPHSGLRTSLDCNTNTAVVSWTTGIGILYYNATAQAFGSIDKQTCSTNGSSCNISSLQCGESYKVSVSGQGLYCSSPAQDWQRVNTGGVNYILTKQADT